MAGHGTGQTGGRNRAYDKSSGANRTIPLDATPEPYNETKAALTAAGATAAVGADIYHNGTWTYVVASLEAGQFCEVRAEARGDGTNWANMDANGDDEVIIADGTYELRWSNRQVKQVRFRLVTDSVGGAVTVTPTLDMGA